MTNRIKNGELKIENDQNNSPSPIVNSQLNSNSPLSIFHSPLHSHSERVTQNRVISLFRNELGYTYLGDWTDRQDNSNIEEELLAKYLTRAGYSPEQISRAIYLLKVEAENPNRSLYDNNKAVYSLLHYGVDVKIEAGKVADKVNLINWAG